MLRTSFFTFLKKSLTLLIIFGGIHALLLGFQSANYFIQGSVMGLSIALAIGFIVSVTLNKRPAAPAVQPTAAPPVAEPAPAPLDLGSNDELVQELTDLLKTFKSDISGTTTTVNTEPDPLSTNEFDNCAVIVTFDSTHNPKTYVIPNVVPNATTPPLPATQNSQSQYLMQKAMDYMRQHGYQIQTLRPYESGKVTVEPLYKFSPPDMFAKPIQFPTNIFNLN